MAFAVGAFVVVFGLSAEIGARVRGYGRIVDSYNREFLTDFRADLLRPDSSLIQSYFPKEVNAFNQQMNLGIDSLPLTDCIIYVTAEGYYPTYKKVSRPGAKEFSIELSPIMMNRVPFYKPKQLEEVTVTASKLKMVMKGDTIVYNADAFALAQGSMLDGLISQLPGVELKGNGQIFVNGKFVNELLVNGENFFKGDQKIALENLPAYMVNDVQVYHRNPMMERKPLEELPLVMDVKLKKQYQTGWIANAEAGYGTSDRYVGRLFGMMFTRDSRLSIVANANNTNDERKPGQTDSWNPNWQSAGRATIASGGLDYLWNSRLRTWKVEANLSARHKKTDISTLENAERYLAGGNIFGRQQDLKTAREWRVTSQNEISFHVPRLWLYVKPSFRFEREKASAEANAANSDSYGVVLNTLDNVSSSFKRQWVVGTEIDGRWDLPRRPKDIKFGAGVTWSDRRLETLTNRRLLFPQEPELNDVSTPLELMPERKLLANARLGYTIDYSASRIFSGRIGVNYTYDYTDVNSSRDYFLTQEPDGDPLPSVAHALRSAGFVASNSFDYHLTESDHAVKFSITNWFPALKDYDYGSNLMAAVNLHYAPGSISYFQAETESFARRRLWYADPELKYNVDNIGGISYKYNATLPGLRDLLDVTDAANPLYIFRGNSSLKTARCHELFLYIYKLFNKGPRIYITYRKYKNLIAQSAEYDMTSGVTTYRPVNVNGNWDINADLGHYAQLGATNKWSLETGIKALYHNAVDMIDLDLSTVRNFNLGGKAKLTYKIMDGMEITANGNAEWRKVTSPMEGFNPISAVDFDYGLVFRAAKLPWNISVTTDLMMHSRRGYSDSRLNTNDLVWNARVAKSILQGNLTFALDGFDILGQLSNVRLTMNSQGRTEARYNTLPRYAMLHVIYRLNIQPKKK